MQNDILEETELLGRFSTAFDTEDIGQQVLLRKLANTCQVPDTKPANLGDGLQLVAVTNPATGGTAVLMRINLGRWIHVEPADEITMVDPSTGATHPAVGPVPIQAIKPSVLAAWEKAGRRPWTKWEFHAAMPCGTPDEAAEFLTKVRGARLAQELQNLDGFGAAAPELAGGFEDLAI